MCVHMCECRNGEAYISTMYFRDLLVFYVSLSACLVSTRYISLTLDIRIL